MGYDMVALLAAGSHHLPRQAEQCLCKYLNNLQQWLKNGDFQILPQTCGCASRQQEKWGLGSFLGVGILGTPTLFPCQLLHLLECLLSKE